MMNKIISTNLKNKNSFPTKRYRQVLSDVTNTFKQKWKEKIREQVLKHPDPIILLDPSFADAVVERMYNDPKLQGRIMIKYNHCLKTGKIIA